MTRIQARRAQRARLRWLPALEAHIGRSYANLEALQRARPAQRDGVGAYQSRLVAAERRRLRRLAARAAEARSAPLLPVTDGTSHATIEATARRAWRAPRLDMPRRQMRTVLGVAAVAFAFASFALAGIAGRAPVTLDPPLTAERATETATPTPTPTATPSTAAAAPTPTATPAPRTALLDTHRVVALYGHPGAPLTGEIGKYPPEEAALEAQRIAAEHEAVSGVPTVGALHVTIGIAHPLPGEDGTYLEHLEDEVVREYVEVARAHGLLVILDTQIGWGDALEEARRLEPYLLEPFVHLALDPEFATRPQRAAPGSVIGSVDAAEVNAVQQYLAGLVAPTEMPVKLLILHQFLDSMLTNTAEYDDVDEVDLVIDMDGFGPPHPKTTAYADYALAPYAERPALKLFYEWDEPLMTPEEMEALPVPPTVVIYQ